jgi:hypothetical protein
LVQRNSKRCEHPILHYDKQREEVDVISIAMLLNHKTGRRNKAGCVRIVPLIVSTTAIIPRLLTITTRVSNFYTWRMWMPLIPVILQIRVLDQVSAFICLSSCRRRTQIIKLLFIKIYPTLCLLDLSYVIVFPSSFSSYIAWILLLVLLLVGWDWVHLVLRPLLAYCTSPRW